MESRPKLNKKVSAETFRNFYYLKEELISFCKENMIPVSGSKIEIADRIAYFLDTGKILSVVNKRKAVPDVCVITEETPIEEDFVCSEKYRSFFEEKIGSKFTFNVVFQKWLKSNSGKTYAEAIDAYHRILEEKKTGKTTIDKQFEYNKYIRDFFEDNKGLALEQAIACWKYKKSISGHNRYEKTDLSVLR